MRKRSNRTLGRVVSVTSRALFENCERRCLLAGVGSGLFAQYFNNSDFTSLAVTRQDATVDFNWGTGGPDAAVGADTFSARWTGQVLPQYTQTYTFRVDADDGARLWVNNVAIIPNFTTSGTGTIALTAGVKYDIRMEMQESTGNATARLQWSSASQPLQVIPTSRLYRQSAAAYYTNLEASLASTYGLPANPTNLIGDNEDTVVETKPRSVTQTSPNPFTLTAIDADYGNPGGFLRAARSTNSNTSRDSWMDQYIISGTNTAGSFASGDRLLGSFWIRGSNFESGTKGYVEAIIYQGQNVFASRHIEVDGTWRQYFLRGQASVAATTASTFGLQFLVGFQTQTIEVGGAAILNYGAGSIGQLPPTTPISYDYEGRRVNGTGSPQWYLDAQARIEQHRKANLNVTVRDSAGALVNGATVQFKMRQHEFEWGSQALAYDLYTRSDRAQTRRTLEDMYRNGTEKRLNAMVLGDLKWNYELIPETMGAAQWYRDLGMSSLIGHTMMWGDKSNIPSGQDNLTAIRNRISTVAQRYAGVFEGWDVLNETYGRRTWENQLGYSGFVSEVKTWFDLAQAPDSNFKLWLNDNNILSGSGLDQNRIDYYLKLITDLKNAGAPVYGMGMQSHFGNDGQRQFTPPEQVFRNLEELAATGVKLRVSEFDMYNGAPSDYNADFMRDFMTVVFSHEDVEGFYSWGMSDSNHWQNNGPWYDANWNLKPAGQVFLDTIFNTWWTDSTTSTNASGVASVRGFKGSYDVIVTAGGVTTVFPANLTGDLSLNLTLPSASVPAAPVNLNARRSSATEIHLAWEHLSTSETGYSIERSTNGTSFSVVGTTAANVLSFKDTGLASDTRYFYRVRATGTGSPSGYSNVNDARTNAAGTNTVSGNLYNDANGNGVKDAGEGNLAGWTVYFDDNLNNKFDPWEHSRVTDANGNYSLSQILYGNIMVGQDLQPGWTRTTNPLIHTGSVTNNQTITGRNFGNRFTGTTIPTAPSGLGAVVVSASQINLSWTDNSNNETGFEIDYSTSSTFASGVTTLTVGANVTGANVTGLAAATTYYFRVRSTNSAGDSANTGTTTATTQAAGSPPAAPSGLAASAASSSQINLSWTDNSNNETGFEIDYSTSSTFASGVVGLTAAANATSLSVTGLNASTTYYFRVRSTNAAGDSANSATASAATQAGATAPAAPSGVSATAASSSQINVTWADNSSDETGFEVDYSTSSTFASGVTTLTTGANATSLNVTGLNASTTYYFRVRATNAVGDSANSNTANATTQAATGLPSPWTFTDVGSPTSAGTVTEASGTWTLTNSGVDSSTANAITFAYVTLTGDGSITARVASVSNNEPYARGGVMMRESLAAGSKYASAGMYATMGSIGNWRSSTGGTWGNSNSGGVTSLPPHWVRVTRVGNVFTMQQSSNGTTWGTMGVPQTISMASTIYIGLINSANNAAETNTSTFDNVSFSGNVSGVSTVPAAPSGLAATASSATQINLTWTDNSNNETGFEIDYSTSSTFASGVTQLTAAANATSLSVTGLTASTTYYFRVRATNAAGDSANSSTANANTQTASGLPIPWSRTDIGAVTGTGAASVTAGTWTLTNSGLDTSTANAINFVYATLTGDGSITARVTSVQNNEPYARAGVMMRETLTPGSKYASMNMYATMGSVANWRTNTGGSFGVSNSGGVSSLPPYWVRVTRTGNTFVMARSADGSTWATVGVPETITMANSIYVGLVVSSNNASETNTSTFSNVEVAGTFSNGSLTAGDANNSGAVDFDDLLVLAQNYGQSGKLWSDGDFTGDGVVDFSDLLVLAQQYGSASMVVGMASPTAQRPALDRKRGRDGISS